MGEQVKGVDERAFRALRTFGGERGINGNQAGLDRCPQGVASLLRLRVALWLGLYPSKFYAWCERFVKVNAHNGRIPRDFWIAPWERKGIVDCHVQFPLESHWRLAFMMIDANVVSVSPSRVARVL